MGELGAAYVSIYPKVEGDSLASSLKESVGGLGDMGGDIGSKLSGGLGNAIKGMPWAAWALAGAAVFAAAFKAGFDSYTQVESGMNAVITATGATGDAAKELQTVYEGVARSVVGDFDEIGAAVGELNTRLGLEGEALESAGESAMKYAKVTGQDATSAVQDVAKLMNNAGISAEDYADVLDKLTVAGQQAGVDVGKLAQDVTANAASFKELGFTTDESIAMLAQFDKSGANTSAILAGMKKGVAEWTEEGVSAKDGFADFVQGVQDGSVSSADAIELFGSRAGITMYDAAKKGQLSFDKMYDAIGDSGGALDQVYNDTLTIDEKFQLLGKNVTLVASTAFAPLADLIGNALSAALPYVEEFSTNVSEGLREAGEAFGEVADFLGSEFGPVFEDLESLVSPIIEAIGQAMLDLNPAMKTITDGFSGVSGIASQVWPVVKNVVHTACTGIRNAINGIKDVVGKVRSTFDAVRDAIKQPIEKAKEIVQGAIDHIKGLFPLSIGKIFSNISLPHIKVDPGAFPWGVGGKGTPPDFHIDWYAKGGFVDEATLIGAGEAGEEMILPKRGRLMDEFSSAVASKVDSGGDIIINLNYEAGADANEMLLDISRGVRQLRAAGAI